MTKQMRAQIKSLPLVNFLTKSNNPLHKIKIPKGNKIHKATIIPEKLNNLASNDGKI